MVDEGKELLTRFTQTEETGGANTPPESRLLLFALAVSIRAKDILELGFDLGYTTRVLALTGARVVGVDNNQDYPSFKGVPNEQLAAYPNITTVAMDTLAYLKDVPDNSFDLIFVDDSHQPEHVAAEATRVYHILRPGGIAAFHDTKNPVDNGQMIDRIFADWQRLHLPAISPYRGQLGCDYGLSIVRKPG